MCDYIGAAYQPNKSGNRLYKSGDIAVIKENLKILRDTGKPARLCSHMPEVIQRCEDENWGADWYMCCVYNLSRAERVSSAITGVSNQEEPFFEEDIPLMYETIRQVPKPVMAFKILGATRRCATSTDGVIVGMYSRYSDQVRENCDIVRDILG